MDVDELQELRELRRVLDRYDVKPRRTWPGRDEELASDRARYDGLLVAVAEAHNVAAPPASAEAHAHWRPADRRAGSVEYKTAGLAIRKALAAGREKGLTPAETTVLGVVIDRTATYSKLEDQVSLQQIAEIAGWEWPGRKRNLQRALKHLADLEIIVYRPGNGRGQASLVGLRDPNAIRQERGATSDRPFESQNGGRVGSRNGGQRQPERVASRSGNGWSPPTTHPRSTRDPTEETPLASARGAPTATPEPGGGEATVPDPHSGEPSHTLRLLLDPESAWLADRHRALLSRSLEAGHRGALELRSILLELETSRWEPARLAGQVTADPPEPVRSLIGFLLNRARNLPEEPSAGLELRKRASAPLNRTDQRVMAAMAWAAEREHA